jgi:hypothetical protein
MANTAIAGVEPWGGRTRAIILDHTGPSSYVIGGESLSQSANGGPNVLGLAGFYHVEAGVSASGTYTIQVLYGGTGVRNSIKLRWNYRASSQGVSSVTSSGGSGMTAGTYPLTFTNTNTGGSGAAGTITVTASAVTSISITSPGTGYFAAPTVTAATGGTPPTLTATAGIVNGGEVASGTNLSGETIRLLAIGG